MSGGQGNIIVGILTVRHESFVSTGIVLMFGVRSNFLGERMTYRPIGLGVNQLKRAVKSVDSLDPKKTSIDDYQATLHPILVDMIATNNYVPVDNREHICRARVGEFDNVGQLMNPPSQYVRELGRLNDVNESKFYACFGESSNVGSLDEIRVEHGTVVTQLFFKIKKPLDKIVNIGHSRFWQMPSSLDRIKENNLSSVEFKKHKFLYNWLNKEFLKSVTDLNEYKKTVAITKLFHSLYDLQGLLFPSVSSQGDCTNLVLDPHFAENHLEPVRARVIEVLDAPKLKGHGLLYIKESESIDLETGDIKWKMIRKFNDDAMVEFNKAKVSEIVNLGEGRYGYPDPEDPSRMFIHTTYVR